MVGVNSRTSCRQLFMELTILTVVSIYVCVCVYIYIYIGSDMLNNKTPPVGRVLFILIVHKGKWVINMGTEL
jgi:hypothetical protein